MAAKHAVEGEETPKRNRRKKKKRNTAQILEQTGHMQEKRPDKMPAYILTADSVSGSPAPNSKSNSESKPDVERNEGDQNEYTNGEPPIEVVSHTLEDELQNTNGIHYDEQTSPNHAVDTPDDTTIGSKVIIGTTSGNLFFTKKHSFFATLEFIDFCRGGECAL
jgi:hypothetical protein